MPWKSDIDENLQLCIHCRKLHPLEKRICDRCGSTLHQRIPHSVPTTWALAIASIVFLVPANLLPMMIVRSIAGEDAGTIMDGVIYFFEHGSVGIAAVIFTASVFVPFFKLTVLFYLLLIIHFKWHKRALFGLKLFRVIHFIGKWSMLDIFVVALMVGLVQFKNLATIVTGPAAVAFMLSVIMTMFATERFDPRLMFDTEPRHGRENRKKGNTHVRKEE
ncbi:paraquat-inducible protein A [Hydrogenimonas sp.]